MSEDGTFQNPRSYADNKRTEMVPASLSWDNHTLVLDEQYELWDDRKTSVGSFGVEKHLQSFNLLLKLYDRLVAVAFGIETWRESYDGIDKPIRWIHHGSTIKTTPLVFPGLGDWSYKFVRG